MTEEVAALQVRLEASIAKFEQQMRRAEGQMRNSSRQISRQAQSLDDRLASVGDRFGVAIPTRAAAVAAAVAGIGLALRDAARNGDQLRQLEGRFRALTGSAERAEALLSGVFDVSEQTGQSIADTAAQFSRFRIAADAIGATDAEVQQLVENLQKLGAIGGGSQSELAAGAQQLGQALASGRLQGDELRSILENMPLVARAIADGLGVSVGELRQLGSEGRIVARDVFDAILAKTAETERAFADLPPSLERSSGRLAAAWSRFTSEIDDSLGLSRRLTGVIDTLAAKLERLGDANDAAPARVADRVARAYSVGVGGQGVGLDRGGDATAPLDMRGQERPGLPSGSLPIGAPPEGFPPLRIGVDVPTTPPAPQPQSPAPQRRPQDIDFGVVSERGGGGSGRSPAALAEEETARIVDAYAERVRAIREEIAVVNASGQERVRLRTALEAERVEREILAAAAREGVSVDEGALEAVRSLAQAHEDAAIAIERKRAAQELAAQADREATQAAQEAARGIETMGNSFVGALQHADSFADGLRRVGLELLNLVTQGLLGAGPMSGLGQSLAVGLGNAFSNNATYGVGLTQATARLPRLARGGQARAGRAHWVGEHGAEPFIPAVNGRVLSRSDAMAALRGSGGDSGGRVVVDLAPGLEARVVEGAVRITRSEASGIARATVRDMKRRGEA